MLLEQRRGDHLLLDLAVERQRELAAALVVPDADQRVLLGELVERDAERAAVGRVLRAHDGLERRRGEVVPRPALGRARADGVADARVREAAHARDLPRAHAAARRRRAVREDLDARHAREPAAGDRDLLAHAERARAHPDVGELLAARVALDLEHGAGRRPGLAAVGHGQELGDRRQQRVDARAGPRGAEQHRRHEAAAALRGERRVQPLVGHGRARDERGEERVVVLREPLEPRPARRAARSRA